MSGIDLTRTDLAINGGRAVRSKPWIDNFTVGQEEKNAVMRVIDSGYLSLFEGSHTPDAPFSFLGGPEVQAFEEEWRAAYDIEYAISMNSATSGLYAAIGALGVGFGDEVIVSPYTMTACALAPLLYGAIPVFADVDLDSGCLSVESVERVITRHTRAILIVHQFGFPADMDGIMKLARAHGVQVIEDCAQAHGASLGGRKVGTFGDIGVFSLNVNKTIQVGEGGVCVTRNSEIAYRLQLIRNHGEAVVGPAGYLNTVNIAGFNYRMTEIHAAMAREQLKKLPLLNERRLRLVEQVRRGLVGNPFVSLMGESCVREGALSQSTYYVVPLRFNAVAAGVSRGNFAAALRAEGICIGEGYTRPLYLQPVYQRKSLFKNGYPFSAPENAGLGQDYARGTSMNAEKLHFEEVLICEHIRPPQDELDIEDFLGGIEKVCGA